MTPAAFPTLQNLWEQGMSNLLNKQIYDVQGRNIGYSTRGHTVDMCNAIAHIKAEYYGIPPKEWYVTDDWTGFMTPVSKYCMDHKVTPKWAVINAGTGQVSIPAPLPSAPPYIYTPQANGQLKDTTTGYAPGVGTQIVDAVTGAVTQGITTGTAAAVSPTILIVGAAALVGVALLVSR